MSLDLYYQNEKRTYVKIIKRIITQACINIIPNPIIAIFHLLPGDCADVVGPVGKAGFVGRRPVVTGEAETKYIKYQVICQELTLPLLVFKSLSIGN